MADEKAAERTPAFKPELNIPVWLEMIEHERWGFSAFEGESGAKEFKGKKIPASKYWMFNVRPVGKVATVWFCYRKETADLVTSFIEAQLKAGKVPMVAVMEFLEGTKHFLSLFAPGPGFWTVPEHATPERFTEFCGGLTPIVATPMAVKPAESLPPQGGRNGAHLDWDSATVQMQMALLAAKEAWVSVLTHALNAQLNAEEAQDPVEIARTSEIYEILKAAAANGLSATAHTLFIEIVRGGKGR